MSRATTLAILLILPAWLLATGAHAASDAAQTQPGSESDANRNNSDQKLEVPDWLPKKYHEQHREWLRIRRALAKPVTIDFTEQTGEKLLKLSQIIVQRTDLDWPTLFPPPTGFSPKVKKQYSDVPLSDLLDHLAANYGGGPGVCLVSNTTVELERSPAYSVGYSEKRTPYHAYQILLQINQYESNAVGTGAAMGTNWKIYLLAQKMPKTRAMFLDVLENAKPAGKVYAMRWLWHHDRDRYEAHFAKLKDSQAMLWEMSGCVGPLHMKLGKLLCQHKKQLQKTEEHQK